MIVGTHPFSYSCVFSCILNSCDLSTIHIPPQWYGPNAIDPLLPQPNSTIDSIPIPSDSLIQHPITPTLPQPIPQPETKEPTSNETSPYAPNQECMATETHEFKPHLMPATEPPSEPPPHGIATSTSPLMTEPLLPQSETPMTPLDTATRGFNPHAVPTCQTQSSLPDNWSQMSKRARKHWIQHHQCQ